MRKEVREHITPFAHIISNYLNGDVHIEVEVEMYYEMEFITVAADMVYDTMVNYEYGRQTIEIYKNVDNKIKI